MNQFDDQYHALLRRILETGVKKEDRTGTGTLSVFGHMMRLDLAQGFPLITTKKIHMKSIIHELLWMLRGARDGIRNDSVNIEYLKEHGVTIWDEWAKADYRPEMGYADGELGPVYGKNWRNWVGYEPRIEFQADKKYPVVNGTFIKTEVDQIAEIVDKLRNKPWDRRIILSSWNVGEIHRMKLPPCHYAAQFNVTPGSILKEVKREVVERMPNRLNCLMSIRSWDVFLGGPFNIAQYALLTMMLAQVCDLEPGELIISSGDTHLYLNHLEQARMQLEREPRVPPVMSIDPTVKEIDDFKYEHFQLGEYDPHPHIKAKVSV